MGNDRRMVDLADPPEEDEEDFSGEYQLPIQIWLHQLDNDFFHILFPSVTDDLTMSQVEELLRVMIYVQWGRRLTHHGLRFWHGTSRSYLGQDTLRELRMREMVDCQNFFLCCDDDLDDEHEWYQLPVWIWLHQFDNNFFHNLFLTVTDDLTVSQVEGLLRRRVERQPGSRLTQRRLRLWHGQTRCYRSSATLRELGMRAMVNRQNFYVCCDDDSDDEHE